MNDTIGIYYERPDGSIVFVYRMTQEKSVWYYTNDDKGAKYAAPDVFQTWKPRREFRDFPDSADPVLPYDFDLWWDLKRMSHLKAFLKDCSKWDEARVLAAMKKHGIVVEGYPVRAKINEVTFQEVEFIPETLDPGVIYVSGRFSTAVHLCCCGCGSQTVTPLGQGGWQLSIEGEGVTLSPSIGNINFPCKSHYFIKAGRVVWT